MPLTYIVRSRIHFVPAVAIFSVLFLVLGCSDVSDTERTQKEDTKTSPEGEVESSRQDSDSNNVSPKPATPPVNEDSPQVPPEGIPEDRPADVPNDSPEAVLRAFLHAVIANDKETGSKLMLPNPDAGILWESKLSTGARPKINRNFGWPILRRFAVGDLLTLEGGSLVLDDSCINANKQLLTFDGNPVPFILVRDQDGWKVDAGTIIEARKAAREAKKRSQEREGRGVKEEEASETSSSKIP